MKQIFWDNILNIPNTDIYDQRFLIEYMSHPKSEQREVVFLSKELEKYKNEAILEKVREKPAMWSEVYSPADELQIFTKLFETALSDKKKIHIIGVTLGSEIEILETYYEELGFLREDINAFEVDFSVPLVTVSCHIENLMWKGSDYKAYGEKIFFCPPIRESGENKALFKGITRGVIAGLDFSHLTPTLSSEEREFSKEYEQFLWNCIREEKILPLQMGKILKYNLERAGFEGNLKNIIFSY